MHWSGHGSLEQRRTSPAFEASRVAAGRKIYPILEFNGTLREASYGILERMNELQYFSFDDDADTHALPHDYAAYG